MVGFADRDAGESIFDPERKHERKDGKAEKKPAKRTFDEDKNNAANKKRKKKKYAKNNH